MPLTQDEYDFMEAAGEYTGYHWGTIDSHGRLHLCPDLCLLVSRGVPLTIRDSGVYPELSEHFQEGAYGSPTFGQMCRELGVEPAEYIHIMMTEGIAGVLRLWKPLVQKAPVTLLQS